MTHAQVQAAIESGQPFTIFIADGKEYEVPHRDYIFLHPKGTFVIVAREDGYSWSLPFSMMTHLKYQEPADSVQA